MQDNPNNDNSQENDENINNLNSGDLSSDIKNDPPLNEDSKDKDGDKTEDAGSKINKVSSGENENNPQIIEEGSDSIKDNKKTPAEKIQPPPSSKRSQPESNYQVSLVDENKLSIKIKTEKEVNLEIKSGRDHSNKIKIPADPAGKKSEIDLVISIDSVNLIDSVPGSDSKDPVSENISEEPGKEESPILEPNRDVAGLIEKSSIIAASENEAPKTADEILYERLEKKNPFKVFRRTYRRNLSRGLISAIVIYLIAVGVFSTYASKLKTPQVERDSSRLIVIQDMPEPKITLENVEDPNAPPEEENSDDDEGLIPRKIPIKKGPRIYRPRTNENTLNLNTLDSSLTADERKLDSLRDIARRDSINRADSNKTGTSSTIPDSNQATFSQNDIGLILDYPKSWKLIDNREVDKNKTQFDGVILTDTTAPKGEFTLFIQLDNEGKKYNQGEYSNAFEMNDSSVTAYRNEPNTVAGRVEYKFYIFGKVDKISVLANPTTSSFEKYKPYIEAVVRSIRIKRQS